VNCREFERRWQELLDERQRPEADAELVGHTLSCPACREVLQTQQLLTTTLAQKAIEPPPELADRVVEQWLRERTRSASLASRRAGSAWAPRWRPWMSSAVAVLLVVGVTLLVFRTADSIRPELDRPAHPGMASAVPSSDAPAGQPHPPGTVDPHTVAHLAAYRQWLTSVSTHLDRMPRAPVDELTGSLRPVADSVTSALSALRRTLPIVDRDAPNRSPQAWLPPALNVT